MAISIIQVYDFIRSPRRPGTQIYFNTPQEPGTFVVLFVLFFYFFKALGTSGWYTAPQQAGLMDNAAAITRKLNSKGSKPLKRFIPGSPPSL
jgi:hypothetical protein